MKIEQALNHVKNLFNNKNYDITVIDNVITIDIPPHYDFKNETEKVFESLLLSRQELKAFGSFEIKATQSLSRSMTIG